MPRGRPSLSVRNRTPAENAPVSASGSLRVTLATADKVGVSILITHPRVSRFRERNRSPVGDRSVTFPGPGARRSSRIVAFAVPGVAQDSVCLVDERRVPLITAQVGVVFERPHKRAVACLDDLQRSIRLNVE